ncbi:chaperone protein dnaJ 49 [Ricinus communis]|uniref:Chaperone protein dnaJ, putative n=1 Tax=Ricinus communis TaxID=3988 RepID=B9RT65_RICCO|nr:chaperone protein dnaJ 49 [Ricinus communis]XP_015573410.1 chaperone protein dnaJ 49 [Ricinus communis]XP_048234876.1 chaperone protein dnaJ 49 [Ricinus communis]EEF45548.1 Chaperone protein dnaJ, putative [Ricinus communis]|eukprot:XP_002516934.1 chaperone protein dnaJ 49 [Ricinus communis]
MDGNKDEALRCIRIAEEAIASRNKERALKFIRIAQRLNHDLSVNDLLTACEKLGSSGSNSNPPSLDEKCVLNGDAKNKPSHGKIDEGLNGEKNYTEEHVELIRQVKINKDYYSILGVEKTSSVEDIRRAYRKLSLKVHPDKNKAPGSEEAFKKVCKAFKCLSDDNSRRQYDQTGLVDEFEYNQQYNVRRTRRRRNVHDFYDDDFDPNEIFRSFFGQTDMFRAHHVYRSGATAGQQRGEFHGGGPSLLLLLQILPFLLIFLLAYLPFSEPDYSLHKNYSYQIPKTTEKHGLEFFVKSASFDDNYPIGSTARANIEDNVIKDYRNVLWRHCHIELQRRHWSKNMPTPHCDKLHNLGLA